jgi:predicted transglutaminase-like cysteine proteinase
LATTDASPLQGWVGFCEREPAECAVNVAEADVIVLTDQTRDLIDTVNRLVNRSVKAMSDEDHWHVIESWDFPNDGYGDCEDFQLLKRRLLVESGLPRRALRMTVVIDETRAGHAVLMVRTTEGDFILDNRTNAVRPWFEAGYEFVQRESADHIGWVSLKPEANQTVIAMGQ